MSRYNAFCLRVRGTEENCEKFAMAIAKYDGHCDDLDYAAKCGSGEECVFELRGALCGSVQTYMIDMPADEKSLAGLSKTLKLEIEIFASDPGDGEFEYYYYVNGEPVDIRNLPSSLPDFIFDERGFSEEDRKKYDVEGSDIYVLRNEYLPDAEWDDYGEEMICHFKIEMDETQVDEDDEEDGESEWDDEWDDDEED